MLKTETTQAEGCQTPKWRWAFISVVLFSLLISLVTRFHSDPPSAISVQCLSLRSVRQHMDRDAVPWTAPVPNYATSEAPSFYRSVTPAVAPRPISLLEQNLYNRPPPAC